MQEAEQTVLMRAEGALGLLEGEERSHAEELLGLFRELYPERSLSTEQHRIRIGHLVELLARRKAAAIPYATLGRALLAHLSGASGQTDVLLREFLTNMDLLGM